MWEVQSTIEVMRALSLSEDADALIQLFAQHLRDTVRISRALVIDRPGLRAPHYRVARYGYWDTAENRFVELQLNHIRQGGVLAELLYAEEFRQIAQLAVQPDDAAADLLAGQQWLVAFPMFDRGLCTGAVVFCAAEPLACSASDVCALAMIAGLLDRAIQTHRLVQKVAATCQALDQELAAAAAVQRWLLPAAVPALPGVELATSYETAQRSSGDYYDLSALPDGRLGVLIADVSGHGAAAAVLMAVVRTIVHLRRALWSQPAALLAEINRHLCELRLAERESFVTAFCAVLDPEQRRLTYSSAGHNPPRLVRPGSPHVLELDDAASLPLGVDADTCYEHGSFPLAPPDTLVLYTDGIVEAQTEEGRQFGAGRLDQVLCRLPADADAQSAVRAVLAALRQFAGTAALADDRTILAVQMRDREPDELAPRMAAEITT